MSSSITPLQAIGLGADLARRAEPLLAAAGADATLERIVSLHRETVQLHDGRRERSARLLPRLARTSADGDEALVVGDWVLASTDAQGACWVEARVPPGSRIVRRDGSGRRHAMVANVDRAFVVMGLDDDYNLRRLERYLALIRGSGVAPLVVLTKADIAGAERRDACIDAVARRVEPGLEVVAVDATDPASARCFEAVAQPGTTIVLLGSSGAGKSTLTNTLLGAAVQDTGAVREHDSRGMHTTTARSLHLLPGGACIVDTPGIRTLSPDVDERTLAASFADVATLAASCRFRDCTHTGEPGCAVREQVDPDRLANFRKLLRESKREKMTWLERRGQLATWKARGKASRERLRNKRGEE